MPCRKPWKKKLLKLKAHWMKKRKRVTNKKKEEMSIYSCSPSNGSNSSNLTLFDCPPCLPKEDECYVPMDSLEISLFDKTDTCCAYGYDVPMNETCENNYATVIFINLMIIRYFFLILICMIMRSVA